MTTPLQSWDQVARPVHAETLALTQKLQALGAPMFHQMSLEQAREVYDQALLQSEAETIPFSGTECELAVPGDGSHPEGKVSVFCPDNKRDVPPVLVFLHGGGFVFGSVRGYTPTMRRLATRTGCIVVGVHYRLLPESGHRYSPLDDCEYAVRWLMARKTLVGGKPASPLGLLGDSAGGSLAFLLGFDVPGLDFCISLYPAVTFKDDNLSLREFANTPLFNTRDIDWVLAQHARADLSPFDSRMVPGLRDHLANLPPTLLGLADLDPMRDAALAFAERLSRAGVKVKLSLYFGIPHGFLTDTVSFPENTDKLYNEILDFINAQF